MSAAGTRACPACTSAMDEQLAFGVHIDVCSLCRGVFLDPGEARGLDDRHAERAEPHRAPIGRHRAHRHGSHVRSASARRSVHVRRARRGGSRRRGAALPAAAELRADEAASRACPRCGTGYRADRSGGVEVDVCPSCGSMFLDPGESDAKGAHTAALFGAGPEAAVSLGPSQIACPACHVPMETLRIATLAGPLEVERARCCGGLYLDGGELDPFVRAGRRAEGEAADRVFAAHGEVAGEGAVLRAIAEGGGLQASAAAYVRDRVDSMIVHSLRRRRRAGWTGL